MIAAVESGDKARIIALMEFKTIACSTVNAVGAPPLCPDGVASGTPIEVIPGGGCEGSFARKADILKADRVYGAYTDAAVYAAFRARDTGNGGPAIDYVIIYAAPDRPVGMRLEIAGGRIVNSNGGCSASPADLLARPNNAATILAAP